MKGLLQDFEMSMATKSRCILERGPQNLLLSPSATDNAASELSLRLQLYLKVAVFLFIKLFTLMPNYRVGNQVSFFDVNLRIEDEVGRE